ncbi:MAG: tetratricopeptide repeat-containing sensor histidine kinase [Melioribacteraceae bacterium]|nr:tetratricopeptide repeat-containing sensor histidine kinase [Melioribacteraceae bacterium]
MKTIHIIAFYLFTNVILVAQPQESLKNQVDSLNSLAFRARGSNPIETIKYSEKALALAKTIDYPVGQSMSYSFIGVGYRNMSYYKEALTNYLQGLAIADSLKNYEQIAFAYNNIGNLYLRSGNDSLAQVYLQKTLDLAIEKNFEVLLGYAFKNLGSYYYENKDYDKALEFLKNSYDVRNKLNDYWGMTNTLNEMGTVYTQKEDFTSALKAYDTAYEKVSHIEKNKILVGEIYLGKARVYYTKKDYSNSLYYLNKCKTIFEEVNGRVELVEIYKLISNIAYEKNDFKQAFDFQQKFSSLNDSIKVLDAERQLDLMEILYTSDKNQKENELLRRENAIKLLQISQEKQLRDLLILISFSLLIAAVISYIFYKGKKKTNEQLTRTNELIEQQKSELSKINSTKDRLFSIIAHDLKNPFGNLMNVTDMIMKEFDNLSQDELKELVESVNRSTKSSYRLLENLLLWSRSQKGYLKYNPELIDVEKVINENFNLYSEMAKDKNVKLDFIQIDKVFAYADLNMIDAVLRNIINNSVKYSHQNGVIKVSTFAENNKTIVCIEDEGIGIPENEIIKIFSLEEKPIQSGTGGERGTGLGLIICKEFIDINKGEINIESTVNKGTKICLILPNKAN